MDIRRIVKKVRRMCQDFLILFKKERNLQIYSSFVVVASVVCILAAELALGGGLREWYYNLTNTTVFNKDIQNDTTEGEIMKGSFLTYYRFEKFGATNPEEIDVTAPMVAFTFDDGPNPEYTQRILDVLTANYSHATFFVVGNNAEDYPEVLQSISSAGCEIGNHTYGHKNLTSLSIEDVEEQIDKVNRAVIKATGESTTVIRPPYGSYNDDVLNVMQEPVVLWDLDTEDWSSRNAQKVTEKVLENIKDGDIVLMHDIYDSTAEAVEILVPKLKEQGYQIVSVSELALYKGKTLELNKAYGEIENSEE